jgi:hypothetical protein
MSNSSGIGLSTVTTSFSRLADLWPVVAVAVAVGICFGFEKERRCATSGGNGGGGGGDMECALKFVKEGRKSFGASPWTYMSREHCDHLHPA